MLNPEKFKLVLEVGQSILKAVEEEDGAGIMATIVFTYQDLMPYLRLYVEEAFQTAVLLRNL
jgi:ankyrin repeat protein